MANRLKSLRIGRSFSSKEYVTGERQLGIRGRGDGVVGGLEGDEERVALIVHHEAAVACERFPQQPPVHVQEVGVGVAHPLQQPSRALNIAEEQRHGAPGQLGHLASLSRRSWRPARPTMTNDTRGSRGMRAASAACEPENRLQIGHVCGLWGIRTGS
jgi:hypothetical protein